MGNNFEIKICGIKDKWCMDAAIESKADYIGLVFYNKSPRKLSLVDAKQLLKKRNQYSKIVALTVNPDDDFIRFFPQIFYGFFRNVFMTCSVKPIGSDIRIF